MAALTGRAAGSVLRQVGSRLVALLMATTAAGAAAAPQLAGVFGDHMVLQRDAPIRIWGRAAPGEVVQLQLQGPQAAAQRVRADARGRFSATLPPRPAGGPYQLQVEGQGEGQRRGHGRVVLSDLWLGELWLAAGQSNMEWALRDARDGAQEVAAARHPLIRHAKLAHRAALRPQPDVAALRWQAAAPDTAGDFSAVAYFFARELQRELQVPVGIVNASWGGTHIETWTSPASARRDPHLSRLVAALPADEASFVARLRDARRAVVQRWQGAPAADDAGESTQAWHEPDFDDRHWRTLQVPRLWEEQGLGGLDGVVWFRRELVLEPAGTPGAAPAVLHLGAIDDCDETWVNGVPVGRTCRWDAPRRYALPAGVLRAGRNVVAVKVTDTGGGGGFHGAAAELRLESGGAVLPLAGDWRARVQAVHVPEPVQANDAPTLAYNGMLHPLLPLRVRGVLWYQGESNVPRAAGYGSAFRNLIDDWRRGFGSDALPFYFVQLAGLGTPTGDPGPGSAWAELRDAQRQALVRPHTGMVVATDLGEAHDIHPRNKQDVGQRLAALALAGTYGRALHPHGPRLRAVRRQAGRIELGFDAPAGLAARGGGALEGFALAGADRRFVAAQARIEGSRVIVHSARVPRPLALRYAWQDNPERANLTGGDGLPAAPFRTDRWPLLTEGQRFTP